MNEDLQVLLDEFESRLQNIDCDNYGECYIDNYEIEEEIKWIKQEIKKLINKYG